MRVYLEKENNYEICPVCLTQFITGEGVLGDPEGMEELDAIDRTYESIEFCSQKCKDEYYRAGRER